MIAMKGRIINHLMRYFCFIVGIDFTGVCVCNCITGMTLSEFIETHIDRIKTYFIFLIKIVIQLCMNRRTGLLCGIKTFFDIIENSSIRWNVIRLCTWCKEETLSGTESVLIITGKNHS